MSFNSCISILEKSMYLRCNEELHRICGGGISSFKLFFEVSSNCVVYIIDGDPLDNETMLYDNKFIPSIGLLSNLGNFDDTTIESYSQEVHSMALMNSTFWNYYLNDIQEDNRFFALSFEQLISSPVKIRTCIDKPAIMFDLSKLPQTGANQYPFSQKSIPFEKTNLALHKFIGNLRHNADLIPFFKAESESRKRFLTKPVEDAWDSEVTQEVVNFSSLLELGKEKSPKRKAKSDTCRKSWADFEDSDDEKKSSQTLMKELGLFPKIINCKVEKRNHSRSS